MKKIFPLLMLAMFALADVAHAHAHLLKSEPANNSSAAVLPKSLILEFNEAVQLTQLVLQKGDTKLQELGPLQTTAAKQVMVPMPKLAPGNYTINWRALSGDQHVTSGKVVFSVTP